ncbi:MAG: BACON domain-containing protein [Bacteroidales bacterium]|nr:BACON domain-containing protein [Bacteroidales bacterium]MBR4660361.1 BACON domain-containing protein [Bacteroidales bacterium]
MKRNSLVSLGLIGIMTLAISGCNGFEEQKLPEPSTKGNFVIMVVPETRTEMSENTVVWSADDKLSVFVAENGTTEYGGNVEFTHDSGEKFTGDLTLPSSSNDWYVLYPYNSEITTPANTSTGATRIGSAVGSYQEQNGNNSSAHLVGQYFPLYGKTTAVPSAQVPAITLNQALSILKVHVTNKTAESLTVNEVSFTGTEAIAGSFYINFTGENAVMTPVDGSSSNTAILKVKNGTALATDASADFYLAIKPFTATSGSTLTLAVNGYEKTIELTKDASFKEGKIRTLNYDTPTEFPPLIEAWEETALSAIAPDDVLVIVGTNSNGSYAMTNNNGTTAAPAAVSVETGSVTKSGSTLIGAIADTLQWNISGNATEGYTFYPKDATDIWLYCTNTNNGVRVGTNENKTFTITDGYLQHVGTSRYVGIYNSADWRCYNSTGTNIDNQTFAFYRQKSEYAAKYAITVDPLITGGSVTTDPAGEQYESSVVSLTETPAEGYLFTSWDVYKTGESSVKVTVENDQFTMPGYPVTVSAIFGPASLVVGEITPAKAECTAGAEVTFTVTSNVEWTASTEDGTVISSISPVGPQSPSADAQTVTVTFTANTGAERTADVYVTPVAAAYSTLAQTVTVTQKKAEEYYELISTVNELETGDYVIVGMTGSTYYAMPSISTGKISGTEVSVNNGKISATTGDNYAITITKNGDGQVAIGSGSTYLEIKTSGTDFGVTTTANYYPVTVQNGAFDVSNTRHLAWRNTSNVFGNYASIFTSEYCGVYLFKKIDNTVWDLKSIAVKTEPKTSYEAGEFFNPAGLVLTATYEDHDGVKADKTVDVTYSDGNASEFTFSPSTALTVGTTSVTISYTDSGITKSTTQAITVTAPVTWDLKSIAVTTAPTKTTYTEGECFDPTGLVVTPTFEEHGNTGNTKVGDPVDNSDLTFSPTTSTALTTANTSITIGYTVSGITKTTTQAITVNAASNDHYVKVTSLSDVTAGEYIIVNAGYYLPNADATSGGPAKVAVTISNDEVQDVKSAMTWTFTGTTIAMTIQSTADATKYLNVSGNGNSNIRVNTTSNHTWTIADYSGTSGAFTMKDNTQNRYCATYGNGSDWRSYNTYNAGNYADGGRIYLYKLADNTVWDLKSIAVKTEPSKTTYEAGEDFNPAGLVLTATYKDHDGIKADKTVDVTYSAGNASQFTFSPSTALTAGTTSVTISYTDSGITESTTQAITVTAPITWDLKSIAVTNQPTKTTYTEGECFNPAGMVVTATFENHNNTAQTKQETVDNANLTFDPALDDELSTDDESVTISYTVSGITKTTTQEITVNSAGGTPTTETITTGTFSGGTSSIAMTTASGVTITQLKSDGTNVNTTYNTVSTLRVYRANIMQFTGKTFTKIEMYYTGNYSGASWSVVSGGGTVTLDTNNKKVVWENTSGSSSVQLKNSTTSGTNTQFRSTQFIVTYN